MNPIKFSTKQVFAVMMTLLLVSSAGVGVVAAATELDGSQVNHSSDYVPSPQQKEVQLTKAEHEIGQMGPTEYYDDSGTLTSLNGHINQSQDNPYEIRADKINASAYSNFPSDSPESAVDASLWTADTSASDGTASVSNTETAPGVEAVNFAVTGQTVGNVTSFDASTNISVDSDANKRFMQTVITVNSLGADTEGTLVYSDGDGDTKTAYINSSKSATADNVIATSTGTAIVYQQQLGTMATGGTGDGSFDGIKSVHFKAADGDIDVTVSALNGERTKPWQFGERRVDTDGDGSLDTKTVTEPSGYYNVTALDTLGATFDGATVSDVRMPVIYEPADADADDTKLSVNQTAEGRYPGYSHKVDAYYRLEVPDQYDLTHSGLTLVDEQSMPSDRYKTVEVAEGAGDTEFENISTWSDATGSYSGEGSTVTLDGTVSPGQAYVVHYEYVITDSNRDTIESTMGVPGGGEKESSGGIVESILALFGSIGAVLGLGKLGQRFRG